MNNMKNKGKRNNINYLRILMNTSLYKNLNKGTTKNKDIEKERKRNRLIKPRIDMYSV